MSHVLLGEQAIWVCICLKKQPKGFILLVSIQHSQKAGALEKTHCEFVANEGTAQMGFPFCSP